MRRVQFTTPTRDIQILKLKGSQNIVVNSMTDDQSIIYGLNVSQKPIAAKLWSMFANDTGDGVKIYAGLFKEDRDIVSSGSCVFRVYEVNETSWSRTLLGSGNAVASGSAWRLDLTESMLSAFEVTGEKTIYIEADIFRRSKKFKASQYFNHIGIWDSHLRLKNRVDFIELEVI